MVVIAAAIPSAAQYPGQISTTAKDKPTLRAVAVLEWTGDEAKPQKSRLVPICIYDGQELQDADVYLARPFPLALSSDVEYLLLQDGKPLGLFDIETAAREEGSWVGYGKHLPIPVARPKPKQVARIDEYDDAQSDNPVLHRKHPAAGTGSSGGSSGTSSSGSGPDPNAPPPDPDRPTLHKGGDASTGNAGDSSNTNSSSSGSSTNSTQSSNSGEPTLHRGGDASGGDSSGSSGNTSGSTSGPTLHKGGDASNSSTSDTSSSGSDSSSASDPDRPQLHRASDSPASGNSDPNASNQPKLKRKKNEEDEAYVSSVEASSDPNRPHLFRGKSAGFDGPVTPSLRGLPPDMHQEVAVSDLTDRPMHVWDYTWANPDDEAKMKAAMEDIARTALGLNPPPAPAKPKPKTTTASTTHKPKQLTLPPQPAPLGDEQFRVFELSYGSGATMVLSAHTDGVGAQQKFVTLVGQPDLYGNVAILVKNVTDAAHLDDTPRMRLVDAVDALADNRGDLLFELRGSTQRQFVLYRVLRGDATRIFVSNADEIATPTGQ